MNLNFITYGPASHFTGHACTTAHYMAYFLVHSLAQSLYFPGSVLYSLAISGTSGSSGFGSQSSEQMDNKTWSAQQYSETSLINQWSVQF